MIGNWWRLLERNWREIGEELRRDGMRESVGVCKREGGVTGN